MKRARSEMSGHTIRMILFTRQVVDRPLQPMPCAAPDAPQPCLDLSSPAHPGARDTLHVQTDERSILWRGPDWWLYAATPVGVACFPALTELLARGQTQGLDAVLDGLEDLRPVAYVAGCLRSGNLHFGRSLDGFTSLFFGHDHRRLVIGDARTEVARQLGEVRLSRADEQRWCRDFLLEPEGSFYEDVKRCFAGVRYRVPAARLEPDRRCLMAPESRVLAEADPVRILTDGLRQIFRTYGNRKVALRLSGGADSRVLLVGLMDAVRQGILQRDQVLCTSVLFPGFECDEGPVIRRIVELSGFEWVGVEATAENVRDAHQHCLSLPTPPFPTSFMGVLCAQEAHRRDADLLLTGHGGDELFDYNLLDLMGHPLGARIQNALAIETLWGTDSWKGSLKAAVRIVAGRYSLRGVRSLLALHALPGRSLHAHRLGRRLVLARGCGYEMVSHTTARYSMCTDVPLLRGPFLMRMDPALPRFARRRHGKEIAHAYMKAHSTEVAAVTSRKVAFGAPVNEFLFHAHRNSDTVDESPGSLYAAGVIYRDWKSQVASPDEGLSRITGEAVA